MTLVQIQKSKKYKIDTSGARPPSGNKSLGLSTVQTVSISCSGVLTQTIQMSLLFCCSERNVAASPTGDTSVSHGVLEAVWLFRSFAPFRLPLSCYWESTWWGEDELSSSQLCFAVTGLLMLITIVTWPAWERKAEPVSADAPKLLFKRLETSADDCHSFHWGSFLPPCNFIKSIPYFPTPHPHPYLAIN